MPKARREPHRPGRPLIRAAGNTARRSLYVQRDHPAVQLIEIDNPFNPGTPIQVKQVGYDYLAAMFKRKVIDARQYSAGRNFYALVEVAEGLNVLQGVDTTRPKVDTSHKPRDGINHGKRKAEEKLERIKREIGKRAFDLVYRVLVRGLTIPEAMLDRDGLDWKCPERVYDNPSESLGDDVAAIRQIDTLPAPRRSIESPHLLPRDSGVGVTVDPRGEALTNARAAVAQHRVDRKLNDLPRADLVEVNDVMGEPQSIDIDTEASGSCLLMADDRMRGTMDIDQINFYVPHTARDYAKHKYGERAIEAMGQRLQESLSDTADFFENDREGSNY